MLHVYIYFQTDSDFQFVINEYNTLCNLGNAACSAAGDAVSDTCISSFSDGDRTVCSGTCATQLTAFTSACGSSVSLIV